MASGSAADAWNQCGISVQVKRTFVQVAFDDEFDNLSRHRFPQSCPEHMFENNTSSPAPLDENECPPIPILVRPPPGLSECPPRRDENASTDPSVSVESSKVKDAVMFSAWPVGSLTVKNTFIDLAHAHYQDEEFKMLQAARRRDVQSCPYLVIPEESAVDAFLPSPDPWSQYANFDFSGVAGPCASQSDLHAFEGNAPTGSVNDSIDVSAPGRKHASAREIFLLQNLLLEDSASFQDHTLSSMQPAYILPHPSEQTMEAHSDAEAVAADHDAANHDADAEVVAVSSAPRRRRGGGGSRRLWCHIHIDPVMLQSGFDLVKKLIGKGGNKTKNIFCATNTKVRIRGRGSGHKETHDGREAPVPLMIALAAEHGNAEDFKKAFSMSMELLTSTSKVFDAFLKHREAPPTTASHGRRFWVGDISEKSKACLGDLLINLL